MAARCNTVRLAWLPLALLLANPSRADETVDLTTRFSPGDTLRYRVEADGRLVARVEGEPERPPYLLSLALVLDVSVGEVGSTTIAMDARPRSALCDVVYGHARRRLDPSGPRDADPLMAPFAELAALPWRFELQRETGVASEPRGREADVSATARPLREALLAVAGYVLGPYAEGRRSVGATWSRPLAARRLPDGTRLAPVATVTLQGAERRSGIDCARLRITVTLRPEGVPAGTQVVVAPDETEIDVWFGRARGVLVAARAHHRVGVQTTRAGGSPTRDELRADVRIELEEP